jgi:hypothetical protein
MRREQSQDCRSDAPVLRRLPVLPSLVGPRHRGLLALQRAAGNRVVSNLAAMITVQRQSMRSGGPDGSRRGLPVAPVSMPCDPDALSRSAFLREAQNLSPDRNYGLRPGQLSPPMGLTVMHGSVTLPSVTTQPANRNGRSGVTVSQATAVLPPVRSIYTGPGQFHEGTYRSQDAPPGCVAPSSGYPIDWMLSSEGSARIRDGELEHCRDLQCILAVMLHYARAIDRLLAGRFFANDMAVDRERRRLSIPSNEIIAQVVECMIDTFDQRDARGYHSGPVPGGSWQTAGARCRISIRLGPGATPLIGSLSTADLFAGCNAPVSVVSAFR